MATQCAIEIEFPEDGIIARARLLHELAPRTSEAIWELAGEEPELRAVHAAFTGRELSVRIPAEAAERAGFTDCPPENQTLFPIPGDLVWAQLPGYAWTGVTEPLYDLGIFYGRDSRLLLPVGWVPGNRVAEILAEDLPALAALGTRAQVEGAKRLVLRRGRG